MSRFRNLFTIILAGMTSLFFLASALAQITQTSSVADGMGTRSTSVSYTHIGAGGQPGGIATSSGGSYQNQAGFLNTFFLQPGLDTDGDGLANEADPDNDNDRLADTAEVGGGAFNPSTPSNPNSADSDGDGVPDGDEAVAGTDPTDDLALLEITDISTGGGGRTVAWTARSNKTYRLLSSENAQVKPTNVVAIVTANAPASPPWYIVTASIGDFFPPTNHAFYAVEVQP